MRTIVKSLYGILLAGMGCTQPEVSHREMPGIIRLPSETQLYINQDQHHYVINRSQTKGEQDLVDLIQTATVEESWLFDKTNSDWKEVGEEEEPQKVYTNKSLLKDALTNHTHYHLHTMQVGIKEKIIYAKNKEEEILVNLTDKNLPETIKDDLKAYLIYIRDMKLELQAKLIAGSAFPSSIDMISGYYINSAVASEYGIVEFESINEKNIGLKEIIRIINCYNDLFNQAYLELLKNADEWMQIRKGYTTEDTIRSLIGNLNKKFAGELRFEFRPFTPRKTLPSPSVPPLISSQSRA